MSARKKAVRLNALGYPILRGDPPPVEAEPTPGEQALQALRAECERAAPRRRVLLPLLNRLVDVLNPGLGLPYNEPTTRKEAKP